MNINLREVYKSYNDLIDKEIILQGWIRNHRKQKELGFIDFYDGTCFKSVQLVYDNKIYSFDNIQKFLVGCAITVTGKIIKSPKEDQPFEINVIDIKLEGICPEDYPIQPKRHTREFLREQAYLRPRTNLFQAVFRVRSVAAYAIHTYFQELGYIYLHTPIITASDAEGAGEMFQVTTLPIEDLKGKIDYKNDFFGRKTSLTVSGQLQGEIFALAYKNIYTFGPTFRAENSNTKTHASEFWMIEPEMAFCDLQGDMRVMEGMLKSVVEYVLDKCSDEINFLDNFVENGLKNKLNKLVASDFNKITHAEAITILKNSKVDFEFEPVYDEDLAKEHEKYLTDNHFNGPVFVTDWPKDIKAFYMKQNPDNKTVAAVDLLIPGAGELMGGSQREENHDLLVKRMKEMNIDPEEMQWYLNLRRFGGCIHSGFGMGFERLLIYLTGVDNIRDVIPFPRTPNNCEF